jgi:hypothetical protein
MRHITLATALAFALAATFSLAPAQADMGGPIKNGSQCKVFGANNQNNSYFHWEKCKSSKSAAAPTKHHKKKA